MRSDAAVEMKLLDDYGRYGHIACGRAAGATLWKTIKKDFKMKKYLVGALALLWSALALAAVNINTATVEELKALPGIGPSKAAAIVAYREQNGQFKSVDDLKNVKGIGEGVLAKLREEATVNGAKKPAKVAVPALKEKAKEKR